MNTPVLSHSLRSKRARGPVPAPAILAVAVSPTPPPVLPVEFPGRVVPLRPLLQLPEESAPRQAVTQTGATACSENAVSGESAGLAGKVAVFRPEDAASGAPALPSSSAAVTQLPGVVSLFPREAEADAAEPEPETALETACGVVVAGVFGEMASPRSQCRTREREVRPVDLAAYAQCGRFVPEMTPERVAEEARRARLGTVFRALIARENVRVSALDAEERSAVRWAEQTARALAGGLALEEHWRVRVLGVETLLEAVCAEGRWSADLQVGPRRDDRARQALMALACLRGYGGEEWTAYVLHVDLHEVETLRFTREEAERVAREALARARGESTPAEGEFCAGCARRWECPARRESLGMVNLEGVQKRTVQDWPSALLREFVLRAATVAEFALEARAALKERCLEGERVPGVALSAKRGPRRVAASALAPLLAALGAERVLGQCGTISEARALDLWREAGAEFPTSAVQELPGTSFVRVGRAELAAGRAERE